MRPPARPRAPPPSPGSGAAVPPSGSAARLEVTAPGGRPPHRPGAGWVAAAGWQLGRAAVARASRAMEGGRTRGASSPRWSRLASECAGGKAPAAPPPPSRSPRQGAAAGGVAAGSPSRGGGRPPGLGADRLLPEGGVGMGAAPGRGVVWTRSGRAEGREAPKTEGDRFEQRVWAAGGPVGTVRGGGRVRGGAGAIEVVRPPPSDSGTRCSRPGLLVPFQPRRLSSGAGGRVRSGPRGPLGDVGPDKGSARAGAGSGIGEGSESGAPTLRGGRRGRTLPWGLRGPGRPPGGAAALALGSSRRSPRGSGKSGVDLAKAEGQGWGSVRTECPGRWRTGLVDSWRRAEPASSERRSASLPTGRGLTPPGMSPSGPLSAVLRAPTTDYFDWD